MLVICIDNLVMEKYNDSYIIFLVVYFMSLVSMCLEYSLSK